ncbi:MAG: hypothetical protein H6834_09905 [Planctomycetes bacterium]|nr:hypothetical protein [Planctomycetota bacterium]
MAWGLTLWCSCAWTTVGSAATWIVDAAGGPGAHFTAIQNAVNAAASGDLILIRRGAYREQVLIDGKALTLQGLGGTIFAPHQNAITSDPVLHVRHLAAGQEVHLRDLVVTRITGVSGPALMLERNAGRVWVEEVFIDSYDGPALHVVSCDDVVLSQVQGQSNAGFFDAQGVARPAEGILVEGGSHVFAYEVRAIGSHGAPLFSTLGFPLAGGDALRIVDSDVLLHEAELQGGGGGSVQVNGCLQGAIGGAALRVRSNGGPSPAVTLRGGRLFAGGTGNFQAGCANHPGTALAIDDPGSFVTHAAGTTRLLQIPTIPYPNGNFEIEVRGEPNDVYVVLVALQSTFPTPLPGIEGEVLIDATRSLIVFSGTLDPWARAVHSAGFLSPGEPVVLHGQALHLDVAGRFWLSSPGSITLP